MTDDHDGRSGAGSRGLDRIKPPEQRLLERPEGLRLDGDEADPQGRAALYTAGVRRGQAAGGVTVHCSRCDATSGLDVDTALRSALPLFLLAPWKDHPVFAVCPACGRRSWLRPGLATLKQRSGKVQR